MKKETFLEKLQQSPKFYTIQEWLFNLGLTSLKETEDFLSLIRHMEDEGLIVTSKKGKLQSVDTSNFIEGRLSIHPKGFGFVDHAKGSLYIAAYAFKGAMHEDTVLVKPRVFSDLSSDGEILRVIKRNTTQLVGTWTTLKGIQQIVVQDPRLFYPLVCLDQDTSHLVEGQQLLVDIVKYGEVLEVKINTILGHISDPGMDITTLLLNHQIPMKFKEDVMNEVNLIPMTPQTKDFAGRKDYRDRIVITIDGEDAKDFDDAISLRSISEGYELDVHIADVSYYVTEQSALDEEARLRGTSVYVVDRVVPMLPHALSNGICSLMEGIDRLTMTCSMKLDHAGNVLSYDIHPSIIKSYRRMTYTAVNKIFRQDTETLVKHQDLIELLTLMHHVSGLIRTQREELGSINFSSVESKFILDSTGQIDRIESRTQDEAESLIEDFMVLANQVVAQHLKWLEVPALYRIHEAPDRKRFGEFTRLAQFFNIKLRYEHITPKSLQTILDKFKDQLEYPLINDLLLRSMTKAKYDPQCLGHFGLALKEYCHFTSPIRRYPDLVVHRMLRKHVFTHHPAALSDDAHLMERLGLETSLSEQRSVDAERDVEAMKKAEYMERHIEDLFDGIISSVAKFGFFVRLDNTVEGLVHISTLEGYYEFDSDHFALIKRGSKKRYQLGQKVKVKVMSASKSQQTIDFVVV